MKRLRVPNGVTFWFSSAGHSTSHLDQWGPVCRGLDGHLRHVPRLLLWGALGTPALSPQRQVSVKIFVLLFLWFLGLFVMWNLLAATLQFCTYSCGVVVIHRILDSGSCGTWCTGYFLLYVILLLCGLLKGEGCICVHCGAEGIAEVYINESHQTQPHRVYLNW